MNSKTSLISYLLVVLVALFFNGCLDKKLPQPLNCPSFDAIELPDKLTMEFTKLGNTDIYDDDRNDTSATVATNLKGIGSFSLESAIITHSKYIDELIDYVKALRLEIELYNNRVNSDTNKTKEQ